jgi:serralysin
MDSYMPALATYALTGDPYIDGLLSGVKWGVTNLTFSAPSSASYYESNYGDGEPNKSFEPLNASQKAVLDSTLSLYSSYSGLKFSQITETSTQHADLRFSMSDAPSTAWAYFPSTAAEGGDAWFNNSGGSYDNPVKGNYAYSTFLHETGHALGLEHPHDNKMPVSRDSLEYSVMSYRSYVGASLNGGYTNDSWSYPQSLMMYDIAAIQHMYGPNFNTNSGSTTYSWSPKSGEMFIDGDGQGAPGENKIFLTIWDGGGVDIYDFSNYATDLDVDLRPGKWTTASSAQLAELHYNGSEVATGNIANALLYNGDKRSLIENAKGGHGDDVINGNAASNTLWGADGSDALRGFGSQDKLYGDADNDRLFGGGGNDVLYGDAGHDKLIGGGGNDRLVGGTGNDRLVGGPGADVLIGDQGADRFVFQSAKHSPPGAMDTIEDFVSGEDKIILQPMDANLKLGGNQAFTFIDNDLFSHKAGELNFRNEILSADLDGDGSADFQIYLPGVSTLWDSDFLL